MKKRHFQFKLTIHPLFILLGVVLALFGAFSVFVWCSLFALLHELGHSLVAENFGYKMNKIRLMPFGAEVYGDTDSFDSVDEIYIAIAGPAVNFVICLILLGFWWVAPWVYNFTDEIFKTNLMMGVFNLLPFFPLDGGRVLLCVLSTKMERKKSAGIVKRLTIAFSVVLFLCFVLTIFNNINLSLGVMAFFLLFTATSSAKDAVYQKIDITKLATTKSVRWVTVSVPKNVKVYELNRFHSKNRITEFIVIDENCNELFRFSELDLWLKKTEIPQTTSVFELVNYL